MVESLANSYDEILYDSRPRYSTHPDCLATLATLLGMQPAPVDRCRVLELGCSTGGNLLPLAESLPGSRFVGLDLSARQIDMGRRAAEFLGLKNLCFEARSILDVDESLGTFDYILCHGVYSWVAAPVRDKLLEICRRNLAPQGVAYVSYNTYPGWHLRAPVREMMNFHVRGMEDAGERLQEARSFFDFVIQAVPAEGVWGQVLRGEADLVQREPGYYLFHEHLEEENHAVYFHEFIDHAGRHGLKFLGEAQGHATLSGLPANVQETLKTLSANLLQLEQYLDFIRNRAFRRTLLVHEEAALNRTPGPEVVLPLKASALARPVAEPMDIGSNAPMEFKNDEDVVVASSAPLAKATLTILFESWPRSVPFEELCEQIRGRLASSGVEAPPVEQMHALVSRSLVHLYLSNLVGLHVHTPAFVTRAGDRPRTTPLIRLQAQTGALVANRRHRQVSLTVLDRAVLGLLDGGRDRPALVEALTEKVVGGEVELQQHGRPLTAAAAVRAVLEQELEGSLDRLGQLAVLVE